MFWGFFEVLLTHQGGLELQEWRFYTRVRVRGLDL